MQKCGIKIRIEIVDSAEDTAARDFESDHIRRNAVKLRLLEPSFIPIALSLRISSLHLCTRLRLFMRKVWDSCAL